MVGHTGHADDVIDDGGVVSRSVERAVRRSIGSRDEPVLLSGSPEVVLPRHVIGAVEAAACRSDCAPPCGDPALREAIAVGLRQEGIDASPERVLVTNGAMQALDVCFRAILAPGDTVLMPQPGFFIGGLVDRASAHLRGFPSFEDEEWRPRWDVARQLSTRGVRALFLNSPVNPTGYVFSHPDCVEALKLASDQDVWIVSDESYSKFVYGGRQHVSPAAEEGGRERVILVRSFSKDFAMTGWRLGYVLIPPALVGRVSTMFEWMNLCVSTVAQAAGLAALTGSRDWISNFVAESERKMAWLSSSVAREEGLSCTAPAGGLNVLIRPDCDVHALVKELVLTRRVSVHPGTAFYAPHHFRFQFGGSWDGCREALRELKETRELIGRSAGRAEVRPGRTME